MVKFGKWFIVVNDRVMDRPATEAVKIIDTIDSERNQLLDKQPQYHDVIDSEARNVFPQGFTATALKCASGFNIHGTRYYAINENVTDSSCPRCSDTEDWDDMVKYRCNEGKREEFF